MEIPFYQLKPFQMFTYNNHSFMKLKAPERSFCFDIEHMTKFEPDRMVLPVESEELKLFKLRVERMVTDAGIIRKIFSNKDIRRIKELKPGRSFLDNSNRRFTLLNYDNIKIAKAHCSNYYIHDFDPEELVEVVE